MEVKMRTLFEIPASLKSEFKARAALEQSSMKDVLVRLLTDYVRNRPQA